MVSIDIKQKISQTNNRISSLTSILNFPVKSPCAKDPSKLRFTGTLHLSVPGTVGDCAFKKILSGSIKDSSFGLRGFHFSPSRKPLRHFEFASSSVGIVFF